VTYQLSNDDRIRIWANFSQPLAHMSVSVGCAAVPEDMVIKIWQSQDTWRGTNQQVDNAAVVLEEPVEECQTAI